MRSKTALKMPKSQNCIFILLNLPHRFAICFDTEMCIENERFRKIYFSEPYLWFPRFIFVAQWCRAKIIFVHNEIIFLIWTVWDVYNFYDEEASESFWIYGTVTLLYLTYSYWVLPLYNKSHFPVGSCIRIVILLKHTSGAKKKKYFNRYFLNLNFLFTFQKKFSILSIFSYI